MDGATLAAYDATRDFSQKAVRSLCYAPFTNLFFDRVGDVRVCCWNWSMPVGNVLKDSMDEIWHGPRITALRHTLAEQKFAKGCDFCEFQTAEGIFAGVKMRQFDRFAVTGEDPQWPKQMEFSISNACNLECVMCDGNHSSAIRAHREKRAPMPRIYSDAFLDSMRAYLPHLTQAKFLGGEPFLVVEHFRLWDMMMADGVKTLCHVTTNGTQYSERIERVIAAIPFGFSVSLDAVTKATYEKIRVNAVFEEVMENARRFREYVRAQQDVVLLHLLPDAQQLARIRRFLPDGGSMGSRRRHQHGAHAAGARHLHHAGVRVAQGPRRAGAPGARARDAPQAQQAVWFDELARIRAKVRAGEAKFVTAAAAAS